MRKRTHGQGPQSHHHLRRHGLDPYAVDVAAPADHGEEIADAAIGAAEAGAAVVHLHARNPKDGRPDQSPEAFAPFLKVIKQRSNCVINITTGGAPTMTDRGARGARRDLQAGGGEPQHGHA